MKKHKILRFLNKKEPEKITDLESFVRSHIWENRLKKLTDKHISDICSAIEQICIDSNASVSDLVFLNKGQDALTFELNNKIIKLTFLYCYGARSITDYVSHSFFILKPDREITVDIDNEYVCAHILELKKLDTSKIREQDVIDLYIKLREDGYLWEDTRARNIGKNEDGVCQLIDYGDLKCLYYLSERDRGVILHNHINYRTHYNEEYSNRFSKKFK